MSRKPKHVTWCTVCRIDDIGVYRNWQELQRGNVEWRVSKHNAPEGRTCFGSGAHISPNAVFDGPGMEVTA